MAKHDTSHTSNFGADPSFYHSAERHYNEIVLSCQMISINPSCIKHQKQHTWAWDRTQILLISPFFELLSPAHEEYRSFHLLQSQTAIPACQKHDLRVGLQTGLVTKTRTAEREIRRHLCMAVGSTQEGTGSSIQAGSTHTSAKASFWTVFALLAATYGVAATGSKQNFCCSI